VALLRTLLAEPRALLARRALSKLDAQLRDEVHRFVFEHARDSALPTVLVTHERGRCRGRRAVR